MTMQAQQPLAPPLPAGQPIPRPQGVLELWSYCISKLNAIDPKLAERVMDEATDEMSDEFEMQIEAMIEGSGFRRGNPQERFASYAWKTSVEDKPTQAPIDQETQMPTLDPSTLQPVPGPPLALWKNQLAECPQDFLDDAKDAYSLGAPLPPWVEMMALQAGAKRRER